MSVYFHTERKTALRGRVFRRAAATIELRAGSAEAPLQNRAKKHEHHQQHKKIC
jgi:hypothetical protein